MSRHDRPPQEELIYGRQPVYELFRAGRRPVHRLMVKSGVQDWDDLEQLAGWARERKVEVTPIDGHRLDAMSGGGHHQGVAAAVGPYPYVEFNDLVATACDADEPAFILVLDHVVDPQNLGSLIRSADAAGVHGVVVAERRAVGVTPAVVRASAGASEHMAVAIVVNIVQAIDRLKAAEIWVAGLEADDAAKVYTEADLSGPIALVVGSEGEGMARLVREHCDFLVRIPQGGRVSSLNAGVAGAVAMFEIDRQRSAAAKAKSSADSP